ncbi:MAG: tetratricopeptide repeat protein [Spirochaetia bacterium]|nr:tetratricopeptide repeat protein [Spirochaetia bacterium]
MKSILKNKLMIILAFALVTALGKTPTLFAQSSEENPTPESVLNSAFYYYNSYDYDKAIEYFEKYNKMAGDEEVSLMHLGKIYLNLKQNEKAKGYFERILKLNAKNQEALIFLADIYINEKNYDQAIKSLKTIVELDPVDERALFTLAEIYREIKNKRMSMVYYKKLSIATLKSSSNYRLLSKAYTQIARYYYDHQDFEKALEYYKKITEINPEDYNAAYIYGELLKVNGRFSESADVMQVLLEKEPSNVSIIESIVESLFVLDDYRTRAFLNAYMEYSNRPDPVYMGMDKLLTGDPEAARVYFQKALIRNPNRLGAHIGLLKTIDPKETENIKLEAYNVVVLAQKIRAYPVAIRYMDTVFKILDDEQKKAGDINIIQKKDAPKGSKQEVEKLVNEWIDAYYTHAITMENLGNTKQSVAYYIESLRKINDLVSTYNRLSQKKDGDQKDAIKILNQKKYEVLLNLSWAVFRQRSEFHMNLSRYLKETLDINKDDPRGFFLNGLAEFENAKDSKNPLREYKMAEKHFRNAVEYSEIQSEQKKAPANYYFYLGLVCDKLNEFDKMEENLKKSIDLEPNNPTYLNFLGYMYSLKNTELGNALEYVSRALEDDPENDAYLDSLGWIYFKMSKYDEGLGQLLVARTMSEKKGKVDPVIDYHIAETYQKMGNSNQALRFYKTTLENIINASEPMDKKYIEMQIQKLSRAGSGAGAK